MAEDIDKLITWLNREAAECLREGRIIAAESYSYATRSLAELKSLRSRLSELEAEWDAAVLAERERCAEIATNIMRVQVDFPVAGYTLPHEPTAKAIAAAIRARSADTRPQAQVRAEAGASVAQRESILSRFQSVGGEKHDHADGTSAEAVEKVTPVDERRQ